MNIASVLQEHSKIAFERLRVAHRLDELNLSSIRRGIIFIFAVWSAPAIIAFQRLTQVLAGMDTAELDLVVLATDCLTSEDGTALWGRNVGLRRETTALRRLAEELKLWLVLGSAHFLDQRTKPTNCLYLTDPEGKIADRYD